MIIYDLKCEHAHEFEGWFSDQEDYERQRQSGLLSCPICSSEQVEKVLSGIPFIRSRDGAKKRSKAVAGHDQAHKAHKNAAQQIPAAGPIVQSADKPSGYSRVAKGEAVDPVVLLKTLQTYIQSSCENVGKKFYDEAMKMHRGEVNQRSIYGEATQEQMDELEDADVEYAVLPKLGPEFDN